MADSRFDQPKKFPRFDVHHWADWVELCCLEDLDETISREDMEKRFQRSIETEKPTNALAEELAGVDEEDQDIVIDDLTTEKVASWFDHLNGRAAKFGDCYPFEISADETTISLRDSLSDSQRLYLVLLLMANLHYFRSMTDDLSADFERLSERALRKILPTQAEVHVFGKGPAASPRYTGSAWDRLKKLAEDLRATLLAKQEDYPPESTGDGGLDLIAWLPWEDSECATLSVFGQCGCTPEWDSKQHSSKPDIWCSGKLSVKCLPVNAVFTPYFLRKSDGMWQRPVDMGPYIHVDRLRFASLLKDSAPELISLTSFQHVAAVLAQKADPS